MKKNAFLAIMSAAVLYSATAGAATLPANTSLKPGQSIASANGAYFLTLQASDGNLVLYRKSDSKALWATYTNGAIAAMQGDRNFVVYNASNTAVWNSHTNVNYSDPGAYLNVENNGTLAVYAGNGTAVWRSSTCFESAPIVSTLVCRNPGTAFQFQTAVFFCAGTFPQVFYPDSLGVCPFRP